MSELTRKKNEATEIMFAMVDSATPANLKSGLTVADTAYYKDGAGAWTTLAITDTATEIGSTGMYTIELTAAEINHDMVMIKVTATGAADSAIVIETFTNDIDDVKTDTAAILIDTTGLDGAAMRGTDSAALAATALSDAIWTDAKAAFIDHAISTVDTNVDTLLARITAARAGYLDNLSAGAVALASGVDLTKIHGVALTETVDGYLAAAFVKLFDVVTPALVASDVMRGTDSAALAATALSNITWTDAKAAFINHAISTVDTNVDTLIARLTAARAGYLDNLSAGAVAQAATALSNITWTDAKAAFIDHSIATVDTNVDTLLTRITAAVATATALATAQADLDTITGADGVTLATAQALYAPNKVVPDAAGVAATPAEVATALTNIHLDHLLAADYDPASKPGVATALLNELVENDGGVSRYTANALEQAPSGGTNPNVLVDTTLTLIDQTHFTLSAGSNDDDAYNDQAIVVYDASDSDFPSVRKVTDYVGSTRTITLDSAPDFTMVTGDGVKIFVTAPGTSAPTAAQNADAVLDELTSGHTIAGSLSKAISDTLADVTGLNGDAMRGTNSAALASVCTEGRLAELDSANVPADIANVKTDTAAILIDTTGLDGEAMRGTNSAALASVCTEARLAELDASNVPTDIANVKTDTAAILVDTGTTLDGKINTIYTNVDSILVDTGTSIPGTIATMQADLDNPTQYKADVSGLATAANLTTVDTAVNAIKLKTDNLPDGIKKNTAITAFTFLMVNSTDHVTGKTGLTVAGSYTGDGGAVASLTNTGAITEISNGLYEIDLTAGELNYNNVTFIFTGTGADARIITIHTNA